MLLSCELDWTGFLELDLVIIVELFVLTQPTSWTGK